MNNKRPRTVKESGGGGSPLSSVDILIQISSTVVSKVISTFVYHHVGTRVSSNYICLVEEFHWIIRFKQIAHGTIIVFRNSLRIVLNFLCFCKTVSRHSVPKISTVRVKGLWEMWWNLEFFWNITDIGRHTFMLSWNNWI